MLAAMTKPKDDEVAVLFVRGVPRDLLAKLKAAAALHQQTLGQYITELSQAHVKELEKKGIVLTWPKGK